MSTDTPQHSTGLPEIPPLRDLGLQFLHVPNRRGSNRMSKRVLSASSVKPPIPVYTMKRDELDRSPAYRHGSAHSARCGGSAGPGIRVPSARMVVQDDPNTVSWDSPRVASATRTVEPPLYVAIKRYLDKELAIATSSNDETGMDVLLPHREAFRMIIEGFPTYAPILCDIMGAYDGALRYYADIVSSARNATSVVAQTQASHQQEVSVMLRRIEELQEALVKSEGGKSAKEQRTKDAPDAAGGASAAVVRQLTAHIRQLEKERADDLEKMVTLIHAVKESESRSKHLEDALQSSKSQVDQIPRVKKELAEAMSEITTLRETYRDSVPVARYTNCKLELESTVRELENEVRRVRRVCAARGSQIDALQKVADQTRSEFVMAKARKLREALSPRPSWPDIHAKLPDLKEFTSPLPAEPVHVGEPGTVVEAPSSTVQQVHYLVDQLLRARAETASLEIALQEAQAKSAADGSPAPGSTPHGSLHDGALSGQFVATASISSPMQQQSNRGSSAILGATLGGTTTGGTLGGTLDHIDSPSLFANASRKISALTHHSSTPSNQNLLPQAPSTVALKPPTMPLLGYGTGPSVPCHLRAVGVVRRRPLEYARLRELTYDFFDMGLRGENASSSTAASGQSPNIGQLFLLFLETARAQHAELRDHYANAVTLSYNFVESAQREALLRADPLIQCLLAILEGALPCRIATDAAGVVDTVKKEIQLLAESLQRNRMRRSAIMEVTAPLLVYKDRDELEELRSSLGVESTVDIPALLLRRSKFTEVLFEQEIIGGMKLYTSFVQKLTELSEVRESGRMLVSTSSVLQAVVHVEPKTPQTVIMMMIADTSQEEYYAVEAILSAVAKAPLVRRSPSVLQGQSNSGGSVVQQGHSDGPASLAATTRGSKHIRDSSTE